MTPAEQAVAEDEVAASARRLAAKATAAGRHRTAAALLRDAATADEHARQLREIATRGAP